MNKIHKNIQRKETDIETSWQGLGKVEEMKKGKSKKSTIREGPRKIGKI